MLHTHCGSTWQTTGLLEASYWTTEASSPAESSNSFAKSITLLSIIPPPYQPQGNGITERMHRTLKSVLFALCQGHPLRWSQLVQSCQISMNQAVHTSTGKQPYFASFFSRHPPRLVSATLLSVDGGDEDLVEAHV